MLQGKLIIRNVNVDGLRTSVRLEQASWLALDQIAQVENISLHQLCTMIDSFRSDGSGRTSMMRAFIVSYFRNAANGTAMKAGMAHAILSQSE